MTRSSTRPPGSTLTTSGSPRVRSLARNASYVTSFRYRLGGRAHCHARARRAVGRAHSLHGRGRSGRGRTRGHGHSRRAVHGRHLAALSELREYLLRRCEAEVRQHQDDFLLVPPVALVADDQGRRHQQLLLQSLVRVHPERSAETQREVVVGAAACGYRWSGDTGDTVLLPGRREPVPVDQAGLLDPVFHAGAEPIAHSSPEAEGAVGLLDSVNRRRLSLDLDRAAQQPQRRLRFANSAGTRRRCSLGTRERGHEGRGRGGRQQQGTA